MGKLKVLFVASDPEPAGAPLNIHEEMRSIQERVRASDYRDAVEFAYCVAARPLDLIQSLNIHRPDAVHFSGHGTSEGAFLFTGDMGERRPISPDLMASVFRQVRGKVRLVVVNACGSKPIAQAVSAVVDCAVGMTQSIDDDSASVFSEMFYGALGFALSVQEAFDQGTLGIGVDDLPGIDVPELFTKPGVDPLDVVLVSPDGPRTSCDAARMVLRDELQNDLGSLAWRITHTLTAVPSGDPVPQRAGEPRAAFIDRDRRWFAHAVSDLAAGYAQFELETGGYDAHRLNLAECPEVTRQAAERAYAALDEVEKRLALYRMKLNTLAGASRPPEVRALWTSLYSRQTANALAILWCQVLEGWALLEPDAALATAVVDMLLPQVLRGVAVPGRFAPGREGRSFALHAAAALQGEKVALIQEEMGITPPQPVVNAPATSLQAIVAAGLAWMEGRPDGSVTALEQALTFPDIPPDQKRYAETSLDYLRNPDRYGGVLGTYLLDVDEGGTAAQAGLQAGDVIVAYNATPVTEPNVLSRLISQARGAPLVQVELVRGGERMVRFVKGGASLSARGATLVFGDGFAV